MLIDTIFEPVYWPIWLSGIFFCGICFFTTKE